MQLNEYSIDKRSLKYCFVVANNEFVSSSVTVYSCDSVIINRLSVACRQSLRLGSLVNLIESLGVRVGSEVN